MTIASEVAPYVHAVAPNLHTPTLTRAELFTLMDRGRADDLRKAFADAPLMHGSIGVLKTDQNGGTTVFCDGIEPADQEFLPRFDDLDSTRLLDSPEKVPTWNSDVEAFLNPRRILYRTIGCITTTGGFGGPFTTMMLKRGYELDSALGPTAVAAVLSVLGVHVHNEAQYNQQAKPYLARLKTLREQSTNNEFNIRLPNTVKLVGKYGVMRDGLTRQQAATLRVLDYARENVDPKSSAKEKKGRHHASGPHGVGEIFEAMLRSDPNPTELWTTGGLRDAAQQLQVNHAHRQQLKRTRDSDNAIDEISGMPNPNARTMQRTLRQLNRERQQIMADAIQTIGERLSDKLAAEMQSPLDGELIHPQSALVSKVRELVAEAVIPNIGIIGLDRANEVMDGLRDLPISSIEQSYTKMVVTHAEYLYLPDWDTAMDRTVNVEDMGDSDMELRRQTLDKFSVPPRAEVGHQLGGHLKVLRDIVTDALHSSPVFSYGRNNAMYGYLERITQAIKDESQLERSYRGLCKQFCDYVQLPEWEDISTQVLLADIDSKTKPLTAITAQPERPAESESAREEAAIELIRQQITPALEAYHVIKEFVGNHRGLEQPNSIRSQLNHQFHQWKLDGVFAYVAEQIAADPEQSYTLVTLPNVRVDNRSLEEMAHKIGRLYFTGPYSELPGVSAVYPPGMTKEQMDKHGISESHYNIPLRFLLVPTQARVYDHIPLEEAQAQLVQMKVNRPELNFGEVNAYEALGALLVQKLRGNDLPTIYSDVSGIEGPQNGIKYARAISADPVHGFRIGFGARVTPVFGVGRKVRMTHQRPGF